MNIEVSDLHLLMFVETIHMDIKGILSFHSFVTKLAAVDESVREVNSLNMIQQVILLSICLSTKGALEHGHTAHRAGSQFSGDVRLQNTSVIS